MFLVLEEILSHVGGGIYGVGWMTETTPGGNKRGNQSTHPSERTRTLKYKFNWETKQ